MYQRSLGILTKSIEPITEQRLNEHYDRQSTQIRWKLHRSAQKLLSDQRIAHCNRSVISHTGVDIHINHQTGRAYYGNLMRCDSSWACPICTGKKAAEKSKEALKWLKLHQRAGGDVAMLTLSFPHTKNMTLKEILVKQNKALKKFKSSSIYKKIMPQVGFRGSLKSTEVTYGINGWHLHTHDLLFFDKPFYQAGCNLGLLAKAWEEAVLKAGLGLINHRGFQMQHGAPPNTSPNTATNPSASTGLPATNLPKAT